MALSADRVGHEGPAPRAVDWVELWVLLSAWATLSGWTLSSLGLLNRIGYGISLLLLAGGLWSARKSLGLSHLPSFRLRPFRFRHWLPRTWFLLTLLVFLGGLIHHPNNYDYLSYRFARLLHWTWEQKWYWIVSPDRRMNYAASGFEWLMAPLFVLFRTDRLFFLINTISFLLLPGLVFSVFQRLGISKRISRWWMWVLPGAYCYALQGGSLGNDLFSTVYVLSAFRSILKMSERATAPSRDFFYSTLSLALATGAKISNLPLVLPWGIALLLRRNCLLKIRPVVLAGSILIAACVSFFPTALLNTAHTGGFTGDPKNENKMQLDSPVGGFVGNAIILGVDNFRPPVWPSQISLINALPGPLKNYLARAYPRFDLRIDQIQLEESGGLGIGIMACLLLLIGLRAWAGKARPDLVLRLETHALPIFAGVYIALLVFLCKLGNEGAPRLLAPYYPLAIAGILSLLALDGRIIRSAICRIFAAGAMAITLLLVIISPARPLFPTEWAASAMARIAPSRVERLERVYTVYGSRYDAMKEMRLLLPDDEKIVGFIQTEDSLEAPLWRPYGSRQIVAIMPDERLDQIKAAHIHLIVASNEAILYRFNTTLEQLLKKWSARVVVKKELVLKATPGPETWYLIAVP